MCQINNCQMICINGQLVCPKVWTNVCKQASEQTEKMIREYNHG